MAAHYYTVTWDQLHRDARALAWRLIELGPFDGIVAISVSAHFDARCGHLQCPAATMV